MKEIDKKIPVYNDGRQKSVNQHLMIHGIKLYFTKVQMLMFLFLYQKLIVLQDNS